ncbi:hypothetical protein, partial [Marinifilum flexuosum]|uniref:hypothetical protein n=1 Tax=Marinifilum flexuosum TaxID=1117708 RepID=UPI00248F6C24
MNKLSSKNDKHSICTLFTNFNVTFGHLSNKKIILNREPPIGRESGNTVTMEGRAVSDWLDLFASFLGPPQQSG